MIERLITPEEWPSQALVLPRLQAHRGYCVDGAQENTLDAFRAAKVKGALMFECDVRLSRDQVPVVFHDADLQRLGNRPDLVKDLTAAELKTLVNAPTLREALTDQAVPRFVNVELKSKEKLDDPLERKQWEATAEKAMARFPGARLVIYRCGVVFGPHGGALEKMLPPFRLNLGGVLGNGQQWMSWIHIQDLVDLYVKAIEDSNMRGIYNAVAPEPVTNRHLTKEIVSALHVHQGPPVPKFALKFLFGEMASAIFDSEKVLSERLSNYPFYFPDLHSALEDSVK